MYFLQHSPLSYSFRTAPLLERKHKCLKGPLTFYLTLLGGRESATEGGNRGRRVSKTGNMALRNGRMTPSNPDIEFMLYLKERRTNSSKGGRNEVSNEIMMDEWKEGMKGMMTRKNELRERMKKYKERMDFLQKIETVRQKNEAKNDRNERKTHQNI